MKRKLLFVAAVAASALGFHANAQIEKPEKPVPTTTALAEDGSTTQYLYNVEAGAFLLGANDWGTRASVDVVKGWQMRVKKNDSTWSLGCYAEEGSKKNTWQGVFAGKEDDIWADNAGGDNANNWVITKLENNQFTISNPSAGQGNLSVVPSKKDTRLYLSTDDDAQDVWAAVSPDNYNSYQTDYAEYLAALEKYTRATYKVGDDIISLAPDAWDYGTAGNQGTFGTGVELFRNKDLGAAPAGDVLTQTITGLNNGLYAVTLKLAANCTNGRDGCGCPTGENHSFGFANDQEESLNVVDKGSDTNIEYATPTLIAKVTDGTLKYGIKNKEASGNWYVAEVISIVYIEVEVPQLANPSFELSAADTPLEQEIIVKEAIPSLYGWTVAGLRVGASSYSNAEVRKANSETASTSQFGTSNPSEGDYSLFLRQGWNEEAVTVITLTSNALAKMPVGDYALAVDYKQAYAHDSGKDNDDTHVTIALNNETESIVSVTSEPAVGFLGGNNNTYFNDTDWSTLILPFTLEATQAEGSKVVITLNAAGQRRADFYLDNVQLLYGMDAHLFVLEKAIAAAQAEADKYPAGDDLFEFPASDVKPLIDAIAIAQAAYDAAESAEAVKAATEAINAAVAEFEAPKANIEGSPYILTLETKSGSFQLKMDGTKDSDQITVENEGSVVYFVGQGNGTYAISNGNEEYINMVGTGTNTWTLGVKSTPEAWTVTALADGKYSIARKSNGGLLGTNSDNGNDAGSPCYGNKKTDDGNYIWTISGLYKNVTDADYATYVTPVAIQFNEDEAFVVKTITNGDESVAILENVNSVPAGTPVIIKGEGKHEFEIATDASEVEGNLLKIAPVAEDEDASIYVLANLNDVVGFYELEETLKLEAGTIYLPVSVEEGEADIKFIGLGFGDGATAIKDVDVPAAQDGVFYNIAGQRVQNPTKGIYIVNGKKVLVK
ncbi:MAG: hypothetical protein J1F40_05940, partial [Prevotellaceae bacterium]|nr:hypothetical protein [Prevotellaceae bacterium]